MKDRVNFFKSPFAFFIYKKLAFLLIALFISMNFIFIIPRLLPYNPVDLMIGQIASGMSGGVYGTPGSGGETGQKLRFLAQEYTKIFGINESIIVQYIDFWNRFLTMNYGLSFFRYPTPVSYMIMNALPWTLVLIVPVIPIGFFVGNWLGSRAAFHKGKLDEIFFCISVYLWNAPYFWIALVLLQVFGFSLGWFPIMGAYSNIWLRPFFSLDFLLDAIWHYCLPFLSLLGLGIGGWAVGIRAVMVNEMESDYIQYSEQLGFSKSKLRKYMVRNSIIPNFTWIPITLASLISETLLVEVVFQYPGLGTLAYNAIYGLDYPLIEATFVITMLIVLVGNFLCDILYGKLDPRIGSKYVSGE